MHTTSAQLTNIRESHYRLKAEDDLELLLENLADKNIVMLGEASHGTHEYYKMRAYLSMCLIRDYGFDFIAVEGDWPACYDLNKYIKSGDNPKSSEKLFSAFNRWPQWMWANRETEELIQWLRNYNQIQPDKKAGFYGLDIYSLWESLDEVMKYLRDEQPGSLESGLRAMRCFEPHRDEDGQKYALSTYLVPEGCREEVSGLLAELSSKHLHGVEEESIFNARQNALIAKNAENYYRQMVAGNENTWNIRDRHMMDTLDQLIEEKGKNSKAIVWAHNTHIGDASYTDMRQSGMFNIGQLAREEYGSENVALIGFGSYGGELMAGKSWGAEGQVMKLPDARKDSWESLCHEIGGNFLLFTRQLKEVFNRPIPHRAVGVVYHPQKDKYANYVPTIIPGRYDAFIYFDRTRSLEPVSDEKNTGKIPSAFPYTV